MELRIQDMDVNEIISANKCKISAVAQGSKKRPMVLGELLVYREVFDLVGQLREAFLHYVTFQPRSEG